MNAMAEEAACSSNMSLGVCRGILCFLVVAGTTLLPLRFSPKTTSLYRGESKMPAALCCPQSSSQSISLAPETVEREESSLKVRNTELIIYHHHICAMFYKPSTTPSSARR